MSLDFQKREAKRSLWNLDGRHASKRYRNKGKGRGKDRALIRAWLAEIENDAYADEEEMWGEEVSEALYCELYGPCRTCREKQCQQ